MYLVLFENGKREQREIGKSESLNGAFKIIHSFLNEKNYKAYYTRYWEIETNVLQVDVGSWSEYFYIKKVKEEDNG